MKNLSLIALLLLFSIASYADDIDDFEVSLQEKPVENKTRSHWIFLLPSFVVHGMQPTNGIEAEMPRKLDAGGRTVATPGFGFEYQGDSSFDALAAFVKDCYDHYASALQVGQYFKLNDSIQYGYTLGIYVRETPVSCYSTTETTGTGSGGGGLGGHLPPGAPSRTNTFSSTTCAFADNLPFRYTFKSSGEYFDIIPTPFLNVSARLYHGSFDVNLKIMSNFYLNEVGLGIPF